MKLNRLIVNMLDWPVTMGDRLRDWLEEVRSFKNKTRTRFPVAAT